MFHRKKVGLGLAALLCAVMLLAACGGGNNGTPSGGANGASQTGAPQQTKGEFLVGVIPAQADTRMKTGTDKLAALLSDKLGRKVRAEVYPDYNGVVEALGAGKLQMAYLGPLTYVEAHERYDVQAIVTQLINGIPYYYSYLITPKDSPYNSFEDVTANSAKINFAFGDINSTSGSLIPGLALKKAGVFETQQKSKFKSVTYTGNHDATALAVQNGKVDVGAIDSAYYGKLVADKRIDGSKIKTIWKSEPLFQYPWAVEKSVGEADIKIIQDTMAAVQDPDILGAFGGASAFTPAKNEDYAAIRQAAIDDGRIKPKK